MNIVMYTKHNCPLCEKAKAVMIELQRECEFSFEEKDIYADDELLEKYQLSIPVIEIDGEEAAYGKISKEEIRKRLLLKIEN